MSEKENTKIVQQAYQNFKAGNIAAILSSLADNVEWQLPDMERVPVAGKRRGREQVGQFFATIADTQEVQKFEPQEYIAQGDQVVVLGHYAWRIKTTGRKFESDWAHVFTVRNGKIVRFREYTDTAGAVAAYR